MRRLFSDPVLPLLAVTAVLGLALALRLGGGFPVVSVDFQVLGPQAETIARDFLQGQGVDTADYQRSVTFAVDETARNAIERTAGLDALNQAGLDRSIWYWDVRFFLERQQTEYRVRVSPSGPVVGWSRVLPEAQPGASLDEATARDLAIASATALGYPVAGWDPVSAAEEVRPDRRDWTFTWEEPGFAIGDVTWRVTATVQGAEPGRVRGFFKVPEAFVLAQAREFNQGVVLATTGWTLTYALVAIAALFVVRGLGWRALRWRFVLAATAILVTVAALNGLNGLPGLIAGYPTTQDFGTWLLTTALGGIGQNLPLAGAVLLAGLAGVWITSRTVPHLAHPDSYTWLAGLARPSVPKAVLIGYLLSATWLGFVAAVYTLGADWFGIWSPPEVPYRDVMSSVLPVIFPITAGAAAAISEEFLFRLLAVPLVLLVGLRWAKSTTWKRTLVIVIALVLPALVWGTLHATWPQQPFWIRAAETGVAGIVLAAVFLRYGILATLVNHYVSNAAVVGALFLASGNEELRVAAAIALAVPLLLLVPAALRLAGRVPVRPTRIDPLAALRDRGRRIAVALPRAPGRAATLGFLAAAVLSLAIVPLLPDPSPGAAIRASVGSGPARQVAMDFAQSRGFDPAGAITTTQFIGRTGGEDTTWLLRALGPDAARTFWTSTLEPAYWQVRFFRPLTRDTAWAWIAASPDAARDPVIGWFRIQDEAAPGASLPPDAARDQAVRLVPPLDRLVPVDATAEIRPARADWRFVGRDPSVDLGPGELRTAVGLQGDLLSEYQRFLKVPEAFLRERALTTPWQLGWDLLRGGFLLAAGIAAVLVLADRARRRDLPLRTPLLAGAVLLGCWAAAEILGIRGTLAGYNTTMTLEGYLAWRLAGSLTAQLLPLLQVIAAVALADTLLRRWRGPGWDIAGQLAAWNARPLRWGLAAALLPLPAIALVLRLGDLAGTAMAPDALTGDVPAALWRLGSLAPTLDVLVAATRETLVTGSVVLAAILLARHITRGRPIPFAILILAGAVLAGITRVETPLQWLVESATVLAVAGIAWLAVTRLYATSIVPAVYAVWAGLVLRDAIVLLAQAPASAPAGFLLVLLATLPALAAVLFALAPATGPDTPAEADPAGEPSGRLPA